jgi:transcriptional regulator with XRE-family HTH domain
MKMTFIQLDLSAGLLSQSAIARKYNVSRQYVGQIKHNYISPSNRALDKKDWLDSMFKWLDEVEETDEAENIIPLRLVTRKET